MEYSEKLKELRRRLTPPASCECAVKYEEIDSLLLACGGDLDRASYEGCLKNAENSALSLPDVTTESQRAYWLSMARHYRPSGGGSVARADERGERR